MKISNTSVSVTDTYVIIQLHGNTIATIRRQGENDIASVKFNHCGWHTRTTRNRLNAVLNALHRLDYAHKIGGFKIQNGVIHIHHYGEWVNLANATFDYDE